NAFERFESRSPTLFVPGSYGESKRVVDQRISGNAVTFGAEAIDALGNRQLALRSLRHPFFIDGERDQSGAESGSEFADAIELLFPVFKIDGVDDGAPADDLQPLLEHIELRR